MHRIGFGLGYAHEMTVRDMVPWVVECEKRGFELAFFSETIMTLRDAISALSAFALSTNRIKLGCTQILRIRTPLVIAQTFATLDELSNCRMILSLGACTDAHARKHGLEPVDAAQNLRENTEVIRAYLTGEPVRYEGRTIRIDGSSLSFKPIRPDIPIWIAATSKTGLKIAGSIGDGVLLNATTSVEYCKNAIKIVKEAAMSVGRDPEKIEIACLIVSAVAGDAKEAMGHVRKELASKFDPLQVDFAVRPRMRVGEPYVDEDLIQRLANAHREGGIEKLMRSIPESVIQGLTAVGTASDVRDRIEEYRKAGVKLPIVRPANSKVIRQVLDAIAPT